MYRPVFSARSTRLTSPHSGANSVSGLFQAGLLAAVASAETLVCATATEQLHTDPRTKCNKELFAQGIGNICCGIIGALPMTGVIVRSTAKIQASLRVRFHDLNYIDQACLDHLQRWAEQHEATDGKIIIDWDTLSGKYHEEPEATKLAEVR